MTSTDRPQQNYRWTFHCFMARLLWVHLKAAHHWARCLKICAPIELILLCLSPDNGGGMPRSSMLDKCSPFAFCVLGCPKTDAPVQVGYNAPSGEALNLQ